MNLFSEEWHVIKHCDMLLPALRLSLLRGRISRSEVGGHAGYRLLIIILGANAPLEFNNAN